MKRTCLFLTVITCLVCACQPQQPQPGPAGLKITDIQDTSLQLKEAEFLINFRVLAYSLDPNTVNMLGPAFADAGGEIRFQDLSAFNANGFAAAVVPHEQGGKVGRALSAAGAGRTGQSLLSIPPGTTEVLSSILFNQQQSIEFLGSYDRPIKHTFLPGYIGWTLYADSSAVRNTAIVKIVPAYWQTGAEDIRTKLGQQPVDFKNFEIAGFQTRLKEGDLIFLAPTKIVHESSLGHALFLEPGRRPMAKCFVIICESAGL